MECLNCNNKMLFVADRDFHKGDDIEQVTYYWCSHCGSLCEWGKEPKFRACALLGYWNWD